jgi:NAD(P)-dependent dehydrogenase (short-subunit alcohol dehydrogenase family)
VTKQKTIDAARDRVLREFGRVDVLVNNAGILLDEGESVLEVSPGRIQETFATNLLGAVAVSQAFVPAMLERKFGRVVNVSSRAGQLSTMGTYAPAYAMSKSALNAFTRQLAARTKGSGVLVNCVCPGWVRTDMGGRGATLSVEEGADTIVWLAMLPRSGPSGKFFGERKELEW